ncbi:MAG TPA: phosphonoacetaldehyde reductase, partial [Clostridiales bacterium]|nr:phosphonoacetaldehyde reductase [Clostridiales bacterium]
MNYKPFCETEILFTTKEGMENKLSSMDVKNIVLVMSESSARRWNMDNFINGLKRKCESKLKGNFIWIKSIATNPTQRDIFDALKQIGNTPIDAIFVFGGGSA